eukprot:11218101-Lingulodinium_polyedra.AAC.1
MEEELSSLDKRDAYEEMAAEDLQRRYWSKGTRTQKKPTRCLLVKKPTHYGKGGWKAKSRVACCGHSEQ